MNIKRIYRDGRVTVQVEHMGVRLTDYTFHHDNAANVEKRLVSLARRLGPVEGEAEHKYKSRYPDDKGTPSGVMEG